MSRTTLHECYRVDTRIFLSIQTERIHKPELSSIRGVASIRGVEHSGGREHPGGLSDEGAMEHPGVASSIRGVLAKK